MPSPGHLLFVCTANVCRSPMAARLMQHALAAEPEPLRSIKVLSAGLAAHHGEQASENSVYALKKVGVDLKNHLSQPVTQALLDEALAVFCMTESHRAMLALHYAPLPEHVYLMREFLPPPAERELPDPYGGDLRLYEASRDSMVEAVPSLTKFLRGRMAAFPR